MIVAAERREQHRENCHECPNYHNGLTTYEPEGVQFVVFFFLEVVRSLARFKQLISSREITTSQAWGKEGLGV